MASMKFVNNVKDLSNNSGFKFRFCCDRCGDGIESDFVRSSTEMLQTAVAVLSSFTSFGFGARSAADKVGEGLRGQERDVAYEAAAKQAMIHFKKCSACGKWVCPENCWNHTAGMCEGCAPNEQEAVAKKAANLKVDAAVKAIAEGGNIPVMAMVSCPTCSHQNQGGKFCTSCGGGLVADKVCKKCQTTLMLGAKFCAACGTKS